jgi:hypothetical protein
VTGETIDPGWYANGVRVLAHEPAQQIKTNLLDLCPGDWMNSRLVLPVHLLPDSDQS